MKKVLLLTLIILMIFNPLRVLANNFSQYSEKSVIITLSDQSKKYGIIERSNDERIILISKLSNEREIINIKNIEKIEIDKGEEARMTSNNILITILGTALLMGLLYLRLFGI